MDKVKKQYITKSEILAMKDLQENLKKKNEELEAKYAEIENKYKDMEEKVKARSKKSMESHQKNPESLKIAQKRYYYKKRLEEGKPVKLTEEEIANLFS